MPKEDIAIAEEKFRLSLEAEKARRMEETYQSKLSKLNKLNLDIIKSLSYIVNKSGFIIKYPRVYIMEIIIPKIFNKYGLIVIIGVEFSPDEFTTHSDDSITNEIAKDDIIISMNLYDRNNKNILYKRKELKHFNLNKSFFAKWNSKITANVLNRNDYILIKNWAVNFIFKNLSQLTFNGEKLI